MSLISDALKKTQKQRERLQGNQVNSDPVETAVLYSKKRLLILVSIVFILALVILVATLVILPDKKASDMKALNLRNPSGMKTAVVKNQKKTPLEESSHRTEEEKHTGSLNLSTTVSDHKNQAVEKSENSQEVLNTVEFSNQSVHSPGDQSEKNSKNGKNEGTREHGNSATQNMIGKNRNVLGSKNTGNTDKNSKIFNARQKTIRQKKELKPILSHSDKISETKPGIHQSGKKEELGIKKSNNGANLQRLSFENTVQKGDELLAEKKYLAAVEKYKAALKQEKNANLYLKLYLSFKGLNNSVLGKAYIEDGLKHFSENFYLNKISAILNIREKKFHEGLIRVKKALKINSNDYTLNTYLGLCHFHLKEYKQALMGFQESLRLNADAVENYYYIGLIYDNQKQYQKALEFYNVFFKLNPNNKNFKHREWILQRMKLLQQYLKQ